MGIHLAEQVERLGPAAEADRPLGPLERAGGGNALLVVASDHGEDLLERGFEWHGRKVYRESTEVPLLLSFPFRLDPGVVVSARTRNVDIWPTILELLGLAPPEGIDDRSRLPETGGTTRASFAIGRPTTRRRSRASPRWPTATWRSRRGEPPTRKIRELELDLLRALGYAIE